jgi:hypothetical protein
MSTGEAPDGIVLAPEPGIVVTYIFTCQICGRTETQRWSVAEAAEIPRPVLPSGWRHVLGPLVCNDHAIRANLLLVHPDGGPDADETRATLWRKELYL